jgi:ribosomal protein L29
MKKSDFKTIKNKPVPEIEKELNDLRARLVNLKFDLAAGKVKNIQEVHSVKKGIAQLLTVLKERSMKEASAQ